MTRGRLAQANAAVNESNDSPEHWEIQRRSDYKDFVAAQKVELKALQSKKAWVVVKIPPGANIVGSKWVYKVKRDGKNQVIKYKARVVAQGFSQRPGIDYDESFAPVVSIDSLRTLFAIAAARPCMV